MQQQQLKNQVTISHQISVIFLKNFKVSFRAKDFIGELAFPILGIIFVIINNNVGKNVSDGENTLDIATLELSFFSVWLLGLSVMGLLRTFIFNFVNEKGERFKETQKIMGLYNTSYQLGWLASTFTKGFVIGLIYIGILGIAKGFEGVYNTNYGWIFFSYFMYIIASIAQTYFFSSLFSKGKMAMDVTFLIQIISSFLYNLAGIKAISQSTFGMYMLSIFPQTALQMGLFCRGWNGTKYIMTDQFCLKNKDQLLIPPPKNSDFSYTVQDSVIILSIMSVVYFLLYFYFDQTMKNEYGTQKPHFWFLRGSNKQNNNQVDQINQGLLQADQENQNSLNSLDSSSAQYHEQLDQNFNLRPTVMIKQLVKKFPHLTAVDGLTLTLFEKQIFCLLGHNGAGKTTTISLLTGLIEKNGGNITINGQNLDDNLDEIRQTFGLCLQKDVLYDNLTVEEHLIFIGQIKGIGQQELYQDMEDVILKCGLSLERTKKVVELSGGNKRKLSLAMALIGKSKIIFLDEPSSGMDPNSRRVIWKILEEVRAEQDRTIVLTTHHMEEAEHLADRIGIMTHGKLLTIGSSNFIKKTFGIGYHLKINAKTNHTLTNEKQDTAMLSENKIQELKNLVMEKVPNTKHNPQAPQGTLVCTLPFDQRVQFIELFKILEQDETIEINLEMNSLEDAFINIGMENHNDPQQNTQESESNNNNQYSDFSDIVAPQSLSHPPTYRFFTQFMPIFSRKLYLTLRSISVVIGFLLPITFQFFGVVIAWLVYNVFNNNNDDDEQKQDLGGPEFWQAMMVSGYNVLAYLFNSSTYCGTVAQERDDKIKYQLNVMGLKNVPYWLGTFCFDYLMYLSTVVFFIVLCYIFGINGITANLGGLILTFLLFGFAFIWQNYACNFLFKKGAQAFKFIIILNYGVFYLIPLVIAFIFTSPVIISQIFAISTPYTCFQFAFYSIIPTDQIPEDFKDFMFQPFKKLYPYWIALTVQALIYFSITIYVDRSKAIMVDKQKISTEEKEQHQITDELIKQEENRILDINCRDQVKTKKLFKKYDNGYLALKNTSLSVNEGEIFGLLGPNGAGKSTTFNILTSLIPKTSGEVVMNGQRITSGIMDIYQHVGITPQFDPLWENLTVKEHLEIYGKVKGLSGQTLKEQMEYFMKVMQLTNYTNVRSKQLSGGNKRKLCVTIALIGGSSIQFFDEPSTGVDPIARRFLWNTLSQSLKLRNSSIVLTTHSMHEAESLCTKIGIQINGKFQCIGTPQELKKRYGGGYNINIQLHDENTEKERNYLINLIQNQFPYAKNMTNETTINKSLLFQIPYEHFSFYQTYRFFMQEDINNLFKDFGISQSSLEQIFLYFSSFQKSAEEAEAEAQLNKDIEQHRKVSYSQRPQIA